MIQTLTNRAKTAIPKAKNRLDVGGAMVLGWVSSITAFIAPERIDQLVRLLSGLVGDGTEAIQVIVEEGSAATGECSEAFLAGADAIKEQMYALYQKVTTAAAAIFTWFTFGSKGNSESEPLTK